MRIVDISVSSYSKGRIQIILDSEDLVSVALTDEESDRLRQLGSDIFFARQKSIAREIELAQPLMIELQPEPQVQEEPPTTDLDDDIPF